MVCLAHPRATDHYIRTTHRVEIPARMRGAGRFLKDVRYLRRIGCVNDGTGLVPEHTGMMRPGRRQPPGPETGVIDTPFWKRKTLEQMTKAEWESLCDGCARCCLNKLEDEATQRIHFTDVACKLLDHDSCRCKDYPKRLKKVPDCVLLTPAEVRSINWLPPTCAYDLLAKGRDLYWWHPLVSGDPDTVHAAGISVRGRVGACESNVPDEQLENWIVKWPARLPKAAAAAAAPGAKMAAASGAKKSVKAKAAAPTVRASVAPVKPAPKRAPLKAKG